MSAVTLDNKTIIVTGAAGFIGFNLVKRIYQEAPSANVIGMNEEEKQLVMEPVRKIIKK